MKYVDFVKAMMKGTELQRIEAFGRLLGTTVDMTGMVKGIDEVSVTLLVADDPSDSTKTGVLVFWDTQNHTLRQQLLSYAREDELEMQARVNDWRGHMFYERGKPKLDLISVRRLSTAAERDTAKARISKEALARAENAAPPSADGRCFVATACFQRADAPEVVALRRFRDRTLVRKRYGALLVRFYYLISPPIARLLKTSDATRRFVRDQLLAPLASRLDDDDASLDSPNS